MCNTYLRKAWIPAVEQQSGVVLTVKLVHIIRWRGKVLFVLADAYAERLSELEDKVVCSFK